MALCGWEARSMFDRYSIIIEEDLAGLWREVTAQLHSLRLPQQTRLS